MRICVVNPFFHPYDGGIERRMRKIGKRLSDHYDIHIVTSQLKGTERHESVDGMEVHRLPSRYIRIYNPPMVFSEGIREEIREVSPDLIHFHYRWAPGYTRAVASFLEEVPVVFTWHNSFGEGSGWVRPLSLLNDELFKHYFAKKCDRIICVSDYVKRQVSNRGVPEEILKVIYNGIDLGKPSRKEEDFILYVGRLVQTKGLDVLAEAMKEVDEKLLVCGKGPCSSEFKSMENVKLLGFVSENKKNELLRKCKFLVLPSKKESFGIVLLEAMAVGKPVVASHVGGIPEVVEDAGLLVPPNNSKELSGTLNTLISDDELRSELGEKAWNRAKLFSWDKIASQVKEVYENVLSEQG
ncbi:hypothetical protein AKJ65_04455 [candidate division MSBL1 archaeon SCGC-AAA259E19]|uniref:Glycosyl transferase family 1 n=1 Tax=candidate division MSBL1 archaeon SCGC-AAA259E19 TaxID=1698264 RepID=A0A133UJM9_9EURY|nr:hypothetical protein AKJ65_04455 [candidate division MSBL1 archaeon SCGC-AAA259E19]